MDSDDPAVTDERTAALRQIKKRKGFQANLVAYVVINAFMVGIWALSGGGYFWPMWTILGWGIGLTFHAWATFGERPISEAEVQNEIDRQRDRDST
jgi:hypothetical protein